MKKLGGKSIFAFLGYMIFHPSSLSAETGKEIEKTSRRKTQTLQTQAAVTAKNINSPIVSLEDIKQGNIRKRSCRKGLNFGNFKAATESFETKTNEITFEDFKIH